MSAITPAVIVDAKVDARRDAILNALLNAKPIKRDNGDNGG